MLQGGLPPPKGSLPRSEELQKAHLTTSGAPLPGPLHLGGGKIRGSSEVCQQGRRAVSRLAEKAKRRRPAKSREGGLARPRLPTPPPAPGSGESSAAAPSTAGAKGIRAPNACALAAAAAAVASARVWRGAELPPPAATEKPRRVRGGGEARRPPPARLLLPLAAAVAVNPGACCPDEAAGDPAAPGRGDRAPAAPQRGEKTSRGPSVGEPGTGACSFLARRWGGGGPGRAGAAAPRAGRGRLRLRPRRPRAAVRASSAPPPVARSGLLWRRRVRERRRVHAVRGCGPVLSPCLLGPESANSRRPTPVEHTPARDWGTGVDGAGRPTAPTRDWASPGAGVWGARARSRPRPARPALRPRAAAGSGARAPPARPPEASCSRCLGAGWARVAPCSRLPSLPLPGALPSPVAGIDPALGSGGRARVAKVSPQLRLSGINGLRGSLGFWYRPSTPRAQRRDLRLLPWSPRARCWAPETRSSIQSINHVPGSVLKNGDLAFPLGFFPEEWVTPAHMTLYESSLLVIQIPQYVFQSSHSSPPPLL